ncbi:MAG: TetR/AcrR family transcriptional regulator [Solirubrobacteraceae bacterium]
MSGGAAAPAAGKRELTKAQNRAAILDAAREVFGELGYGAATVRDITRASGLAAGTFYNYFPDKEAVFRALLGDSVARLRPGLQAARSEAADFEGFVREGFRAYFEFVASDPTTFALLRRTEGTIRTLFDLPAVGAGVAELERDLEAAVGAGLLAPVDVGYTAAAMVGVGFEIAVRMVEREPADVAAATDFATALFLGGLVRVSTAARQAPASA